jgi:hypothetical protein
VRIAYIAPYQGPDLINRRPILSNLGLAANYKIELISELLHRNGYNVEVLSQGEVNECPFRFYKGFYEPKLFHPEIPVFYASALSIRFMRGLWSSWKLRKLLIKRHGVRSFDAVIIYNLKRPQVHCANYASERLGLPVLVEYEDDSFVDIVGKTENGLRAMLYKKSVHDVLDAAAGCIGASPYLLSRMPGSIPKILLRGVVDEAILRASKRPLEKRQNWVVFSGTHTGSKGIEPLITAWKALDLPGWELHIGGVGELTEILKKMAGRHKSILFHGLLSRQEYVRLLSQVKIGINPHNLSKTPGNVFAFKIIEYLGAGAHCITTPMGELEPGIEMGITYMPDNKVETIAETLIRVISERRWERSVAQYVWETYGSEAVTESLGVLLQKVLKN